MLSQASVQSLMAEVDADHHNAEDRQCPSASASPATTKEKKKVKVKQEVCWFHKKWGKEAKSCRQLWSLAAPVRHQLQPGYQRPLLQLQLCSRPGSGPQPRIECPRTGNLSASKHHLVGAGRARIDCYGSRMIALQFSGKGFIWDFEVTEVKKPILEADFLTAHSFIVDLQRGCLTSNEDQHLMLPCDLHVLSSSGDFSINKIHHLLEKEFRYVTGYEPFEHPPPGSTTLWTPPTPPPSTAR